MKRACRRCWCSATGPGARLCAREVVPYWPANQWFADCGDWAAAWLLLRQLNIPRFEALSYCRSNKCHALRLLRSSEQSGLDQMVIDVAIFNCHINKMFSILIKDQYKHRKISVWRTKRVFSSVSASSPSGFSWTTRLASGFRDSKRAG